ncbi:MAG: LysR family transcriptional regulator [SAR324 cluster bacterium]|nr:LysR family transcriptional regulator [SAR324 cluster bacterium]
MLLFADVVNYGSYTKAANKRHISRSVVSKQISKLELELDVRLFHRTTRSLSLTEIGKIVFQQALKIRKNLEETQALLEIGQQKIQGLLRITCPSHFGFLHIQPIVYRFMKDYPDIQVELSFENRYIDIVAEGIDLAIRITHPKDSNLIALKLADNPVKMIASVDFTEQYGLPENIYDLKNHPCVVYSAEGVLVDHWQYYEGKKVQSIKVNPVFLTNDGNTLLESVKAGIGIGLLADFMLGDSIKKKELIMILPETSLVPYSPIYAMYSSREYLPPKLAVFLEYLKKFIGKPPYWKIQL